MQQPDHDHVTRWRNPTDATVKLSIHRNRGERRAKYEIAPGAELTLPGEYDSAIHQKHNGVIVGGLAPQLVVVGQEKAPVASTLGLGGATAARTVPLVEVEKKFSEMEADFDKRMDAILSRAEGFEDALGRERTARLAAEAETARLRAMLEQATAPAATTKGAKPVPVAAPKGDSALPTS